MGDQVSDESMILPRVARGDPDGVRECIQRYGGLVWYLARRYNLSAHDAEDAVQEVFIELWKNAGRFDPAKGSEKLFIATLARRRLIDRYRTDARRLDTEHLDEQRAGGLSGNGGMEQAVEVERVAQAMQALDPQQRRLIEMNIVRGLTHSEIVEATDLPLGTVKSHLRRGLLRLRSLIEEGASPDKGEQDKT
jgi:RNA polymerase sigma-70 factor (ECF subfamily)